MRKDIGVSLRMETDDIRTLVWRQAQANQFINFKSLQNYAKSF
jgi:hypothetical protein